MRYAITETSLDRSRNDQTFRAFRPKESKLLESILKRGAKVEHPSDIITNDSTMEFKESVLVPIQDPLTKEFKFVWFSNEVKDKFDLNVIKSEPIQEKDDEGLVSEQVQMPIPPRLNVPEKRKQAEANLTTIGKGKQVNYNEKYMNEERKTMKKENQPEKNVIKKEEVNIEEEAQIESKQIPNSLYMIHHSCFEDNKQMQTDVMIDKKPYHCDKCSKKYFTKVALNKHKNEVCYSTDLCHNLYNLRKRKNTLVEPKVESPSSPKNDDEKIAIMKDEVEVPQTIKVSLKKHIACAEASAKKESNIIASKINKKQSLKKRKAEFPIVLSKKGNNRIATKENEAKEVQLVHKNDYKCDRCFRIYKSPKFLRKHKIVHTPGYLVGCATCGDKFKTKRNLLFHIRRKHSNAALKYFCDYCGSSFNLKLDLRRHIVCVHLREMSSCQICGKIVKQMKHHERVHMQRETGNSREHKCSKCYKKFHYRSSFENHMKIHEEGIKCSLCDNIYFSKKRLRLHKRIDHERVFTCVLCQKVMPYISVYQYHMLRHIGINPYKCDVCEMSFTTRNTLISHRERHIGPLSPLIIDPSYIDDLIKNYLDTLQNGQVDGAS